MLSLQSLRLSGIKNEWHDSLFAKNAIKQKIALILSLCKEQHFCSCYHYCTTSFNKAWTQALRRFKSCSLMSEIRDGEDLWQWSEMLNAFSLSSVNHTAKTIHHHHHHHHHHHYHHHHDWTLSKYIWTTWKAWTNMFNETAYRGYLSHYFARL